MVQKLYFANETYAAINVLSLNYDLMLISSSISTRFPSHASLRKRLLYQQNSKTNEPENNDDEHATVQNDGLPTRIVRILGLLSLENNHLIKSHNVRLRFMQIIKAERKF